MSGEPRVSFLLPIYNAGRYLAATLESLWGQTYRDFEVVAINDGSTDGCGEILREAARREPRLRVIDRENRGLVETLNEAWGASRGEYLARIDADDICLPGRLATQVDYLDQHAEVAVAGSATETFSEEAGMGGGTIVYPADPAAAMLFRSVVAHPAVMIRRASLEAHGLQYRQPYRCAQDYDLWCRCVTRGLRIVNLSEVLIRYRLHAQQITQALAEATQMEGEAIRNGMLEELGLRPTGDDLVVHNAIARDRVAATQEGVDRATQWLSRLATDEVMTGKFDRETLLKVLTGRYVAVVRHARKNGLRAVPPELTPFGTYVLPGALD